MRLIFLLLLSSISYANASGPDIRIVPYSTSGIALHDKEDCERRGRVSASAVQNASMGVELPDQLQKWDEQMLMPKYQAISTDERAVLRELLPLGWEVFNKYPDVKSKAFGNMIDNACIIEKKYNATRVEI